jgi:hypothetical protein
MRIGLVYYCASLSSVCILESDLNVEEKAAELVLGQLRVS